MSSLRKTSSKNLKIRGTHYPVIQITDTLSFKVLPPTTRGEMLLMLPWRHFYRRVYSEIKNLKTGGNVIRLRLENRDKAWHIAHVTTAYYQRLIKNNQWPFDYKIKVTNKGPLVIIRKDPLITPPPQATPEA